MSGERITRLELQLAQVQEQVAAQQLVLSWLLAKHPEEALVFLRSQANEFEASDPRKYEEWVAVLDDLTEDVEHWRDQWVCESDKTS